MHGTKATDVPLTSYHDHATNHDGQRCSMHWRSIMERRALPACNYFYKLAASVHPPKNNQETQRLQGLLDACVLGRYQDVRMNLMAMRENGQPLPWQQMLLAAFERGRPELVRLCCGQSDTAVLDADAAMAIYIGASPELYEALVEVGWPQALLGGKQALTGVLFADISREEMPLIEFLLNAGAEPTRKNIVNAAMSSRLEIMKALIAHGGDAKGTGALQVAVYKDNVALIAYLVDQLEVDVDEVPHEDTFDPREGINSTPLLRAIAFRRVKAAQALLQRGADPAKKDQLGRNGFELARGCKQLEDLLGAQ